MTKTPEQLAREQAEAVLKIQQDAVETQMKMMEQLYGNNPEMLAQMKAQLQATMANQAEPGRPCRTGAGRGLRGRRRRAVRPGLRPRCVDRQPPGAGPGPRHFG